VFRENRGDQTSAPIHFTYRAIAEAFFGSVRASAKPWKTASVRDITICLVRNGRKLMTGGYRDLLRGRSPTH
jgi:hypothetical protein